MRALGLMSGTSLDGVDAAIVETDGADLVRPGPFVTLPYDAPLRARLRRVLGDPAAAAAVEQELTMAHRRAVEVLLQENSITYSDIDIIGFHGQTILHRPEAGRTWQVGDGAALARMTGVAVVNDFRSADVAAGGQGAPLVPVYHQALAAALTKPLAVVNIGGVANVTWIGADGSLLAFDTGPGNALIDDWALRHTGRAIDPDGALAATGTVDAAILGRLLTQPFFRRKPPKSLDRNDFSSDMIAGLSPADGARTLAAFTAHGIAAAAAHFPAPPREWLICGGGRHNPVLMRALAAAVAQPVRPVEAVGWRGDALEAEAFAYLAVRVIRALPTSFPSTTGARHPVCGGTLHRPASQ
jgi:anhydro-N-acetylmuramic acid kinase